MKVGVAKETAPGERRVALVPEALGKLQAAGLEILVETGAGAGASIPDSAFTEAGAAFDENFEPGALELAERFGYQGDAPLSGRGLLGDTDLHGHHLRYRMLGPRTGLDRGGHVGSGEGYRLSRTAVSFRRLRMGCDDQIAPRA